MSKGKTSKKTKLKSEAKVENQLDGENISSESQTVENIFESDNAEFESEPADAGADAALEADVDAEVEIPSMDMDGPGFLAAIEANSEEGEALKSDAASDESDERVESSDIQLDGTELDSFESAEIEETEFVSDDQVEAIVESILFASDRPVSLASIKVVFKGTNVRTDKIRRTIEKLASDYADVRRGITLEEVPGGYQIRTKMDSLNFLRRILKTRQFKLSGPALEVLSIVAYKQPTVKSEVDEIRGVESGHLLRALMERGLVSFEGKSDLPGRPMFYGTTKKFLEIFGLRNLKELPTLSDLDQLIPEGIGDDENIEKQTLSSITDTMSESITTGQYSTGEEELQKIENQLGSIDTSSEFFEEEKVATKKRKKIMRRLRIFVKPWSWASPYLTEIRIG